MYFSGPKSYRVMQKYFILPTPRLLRHKIENFHFPPGLHQIVMEYFKVQIASFNDLDKLCILCMDEASLKANLFYDISSDEVIGLEDMGDGHKVLKPACNLNVLYLKGAFK